MKKLIVLITLAIVTVANAGFFASTDRCSYTGSLTKYETLADAQNAQNAVGGPYAIPNRATDLPYDTGYRDAGIFIVNDAASYYDNYNILATAWWYTTDTANGEYSGWGNPNNTNTGFMQLYDSDSSTVTTASGAFNSSLTEFTLQETGGNAGSADYARLWHAPGVGGAAGLTAGTYIEYSMDITFGGLNGAYDSGLGMYYASGHPTSVDGAFNAIFQNTNTVDTQYNGFYVVDFTFGMDNWAYGQGDALNGALTPSEFGSSVPEPATMVLLGLGSLLIRRKK
jgi:hypothetical protein